jgi:hypothetical protein
MGSEEGGYGEKLCSSFVLGPMISFLLEGKAEKCQSTKMNLSCPSSEDSACSLLQLDPVGHTTAAPILVTCKGHIPNLKGKG